MTGKLIHDLPNFAISISFIVNIENSAVNRVSAVFSGVVVCYYMGSLIYCLLSELFHPKAKLSYVFDDEPFGPLDFRKCVLFTVV